MITKRFITILAISLAVYFLPEIFFENALLYIVGGSIGGTLQEALKVFTENPPDFLVFFLWLVLLIGFVFLYYRTGSKPLKYFVLIVIAFFLYIVDFTIFEMLPDNVSNYYYVLTGSRILVKGLLLTLIIYFESKRRLSVVQA